MKKLIAILSLTMALVACGFHLRGSYNVDPIVKQVGVDVSTNSPIRQELLLKLQTVGIDTEHGGDLHLVIDRENLIKQTSAVSSTAKAAEYTLIYNVQYRMRYASGRAATSPRNFYLRRSYQYDPTSVVGKSTEEETLINELHSDAVQQIVRQVAALRPQHLMPDADPAEVPVTTPDIVPVPAEISAAPADASAPAP